jgi:hypothetical protein
LQRFHASSPRLAVKGQRLGERCILFPRQPLSRRHLGSIFPSLKRGEFAEWTLSTKCLVDQAGEGINVIASVRFLPLKHLATGVGRSERAHPEMSVQQWAARHSRDAEVGQFGDFLLRSSGLEYAP